MLPQTGARGQAAGCRSSGGRPGPAGGGAGLPAERRRMAMRDRPVPHGATWARIAPRVIGDKRMHGNPARDSRVFAEGGSRIVRKASPRRGPALGAGDSASAASAQRKRPWRRPPSRAPTPPFQALSGERLRAPGWSHPGAISSRPAGRAASRAAGLPGRQVRHGAQGALRFRRRRSAARRLHVPVRAAHRLDTGAACDLLREGREGVQADHAQHCPAET